MTIQYLLPVCLVGYEIQKRVIKRVNTLKKISQKSASIIIVSAAIICFPLKGSNIMPPWLKHDSSLASIPKQIFGVYTQAN